MAKKTGRARKKTRSIRLSPTQMMRPGAEHAPVAGPVEVTSEPADLRQEYRYVLGDVARALALAGVILVAVIASVLALS